MKKIIMANNENISTILRDEIKKSGYNTDLNHIDVSQVKNMDSLFNNPFMSRFEGDISEWNVSNVISMADMFNGSWFNGDFGKYWRKGCQARVHRLYFEPVGLGAITRPGNKNSRFRRLFGFGFPKGVPLVSYTASLHVKRAGM